MVELIRHTGIYREDLAIGNGIAEVQLADSRIVALRQVHIGTLGIEALARVTPTAVVQLSVAGLIPAGARSLGVTYRVLSALGTSNGLTGIDIGEAFTMDRWGTNTGIAEGYETSQADFTLSEMPIYQNDTNVLLTAIGGTFDTSGLLEVKSKYFFLTHD